MSESGALRAAESSALRAELLAGIRRRRDEFAAAGDRAEELRTLPTETVATLRAMGAFWLKTPAELGGTPLAPLDFCDVMEEFGYRAGPDRLGWVTPTYVGETDKKAVEEARGPIEWYFHKSLRQPPGAALPPGYIPLDSMRAGLARGQRRIPTDTMPIEDLIKGGYILVGSPNTVAERIAELEEELGFGMLGVNLTVGSIGESQARENIEAFAKEVMPRFRKPAP